MKNKWYNIKNETDQVKIEIYDFIGEGGVTAKDFIEDLKQINPSSAIELRINSYGGSVIDGFAIFNYLRDLKNFVTVKVDGIAASISSIIALAGDKLIMPNNSMLMIHNPYIEDDEGDSNNNAILKKITSQIAEIYAEKCKKPIATILKLMNEETWFTGAEAFEFGFADSIGERIKMKASFDASKLTHIKKKENIMALVKDQEVAVVDKAPVAETKVEVIEVKTTTVIESTEPKKEDEVVEEVVEAVVEPAKEDETEVVEEDPAVDPKKEDEEVVAKLNVEILNKQKTIDELTAGSDTLENNIKDLENKVIELEKKITLLNKDLEGYVNTEAQRIIDQYVSDGKIKVDQKTSWVNRYIKDRSDTLSILDSLLPSSKHKNTPLAVNINPHEGLKGLELSIAVAKANGGKVV